LEHGLASLRRVESSECPYFSTESIDGDVLGHGWFSAKLHVRRNLVGSGGGNQLKVRYFSHAAIRAGRDFAFVLMPGDDGGYVIRRFASTSARLENECGLTKAASSLDRT
jgi:hypothetical protein